MDSEIERFLKEDIADGDITSDLFINTNETSNAEIICRESGILSGKNELTQIFNHFMIESDWLYKDGDEILKDSRVVTLKGFSKSLLLSERVSLNLLGHMSGIAVSYTHLTLPTKA